MLKFLLDTIIVEVLPFIQKIILTTLAFKSLTSLIFGKFKIFLIISANSHTIGANFGFKLTS
jgi:hypothetical protein